MFEPEREIPPTQWIPFLDEFTRVHRGRRVRVEVQGKVEAHDLLLQGVSADDRGSERDVNIIVGDENNPALTHIVPDAARLLVEHPEAGDEAVLVVVAGDGSQTTVRVAKARRAA